MDFLKHLSSYTICTGLITVCGAALTFLLTQRSFLDGRKKYLGLSGKQLKQYAAYITLAFAILTLFIQNRHDYFEAEKKRQEKDQADREEQHRLALTLTAIKQTLDAQHVTQDSIKRVMNQQRTTISFDSTILVRENLSLKNYINLNKGQHELGKGVRQNIKLTQGTLDTQSKSLTIVSSTAKDVQALNFPIAQNLGAMFNIRVYVEGAGSLWKDSQAGTHLVMKAGREVRTFVDTAVGKLQPNDLVAYWKLSMFILSQYGYAHQMYIDSKAAQIRFAGSEGVYSGSGSYVFNNDIYFNAKEGYFEFTVPYINGFIEYNSTNLNSFQPLLNNGDLFIKIKYGYDQVIQLPMPHNKTASIRIKKIVIANVKQLNYGNGLQEVLPAKSQPVPDQQKAVLLKKLFNEDASEDQLWRYDIVRVPITDKP